MNPIPFIPESAPFTPEQRAWLNGFLAGMFAHVPPEAFATEASNGNKAGEPLLVMFGSQTGSAEGLAKKLANEARQMGFAPSVFELNEFEKAGFSAANKAVIISSTWGDGDPPDNAARFWTWLQSDTAPRLDHLQFAVLGLGDRNYSDFCGASKKFDLRLEALGGKRLSPRGECDVDYEATAKIWIHGLWDKLGAAANGAVVNGSNGVNGERKDAGLTKVNGSSSIYGKLNPFPARLLNNVLLNKTGSAKEVRHYELSLEGSGLAYEAGDALGVLPINCPALVGDVLAALRCDGERCVRAGEEEMPLSEALIRHYDLGKPSSALLSAVTNSQDSPSLVELRALLAPERATDLKQWLYGRDVLDVLRLLSAPMKLEEFLPLLRKLAPRLYSISSSPKAHPGEVHLTVSAVRYESFDRGRKGVASTFLADRAGDSNSVKVFVQPSHGFKLPASGDTPILMVGPGTGIAPFRAFLEDRAASGAKGRNWLFFGDQRRATDFLYEDQLAAWQKSGLLTRLDVAFSRDQTEKVYVQHRMLENAKDIWSWLEAGAHFYVCGDASRMAKDVDDALHRIIESAGGKSSEEAKAYVVKLKSEKRYQRDVY